jgi:hypothetical protein
MMRLCYRELKWSGRSLRSDVATAYRLFGSGGRLGIARDEHNGSA